MTNPRVPILAFALILCAACARPCPAAGTGGCPGAWLYFRKTVVLDNAPERVCIMSPAASYFLSVNGTRAAQGVPGGAGLWSAWDVSRLMRPGANTVAVFMQPVAEPAQGGCLGPVVIFETGTKRTVLYGEWKSFLQSAGDVEGVPVFDARLAPGLQTRPVSGYADHAGLFMQYAHWTDAEYDDEAWSSVSATTAAPENEPMCASLAPGAPPESHAYSVIVCGAEQGGECAPAEPSPDSNGILIPVRAAGGAGQALRLTLAPPLDTDSAEPGMVSLRFFASEPGAIVDAGAAGIYITRQGLQRWDTFLDLDTDELEIFLRSPGGGVFLVDAALWRAAR